VNMTQGVEPFRWWQYDGWCSAMSLDRLPTPESALWEAHYSNDCERGKRTTRALIEPWARLMVLMESDISVSNWNQLLGYNVQPDRYHHGGGLHVTDPGGWLNVHLDYALHPHDKTKVRSLNLIAFLNPEWKHEWGGALILCEPLGKVCKRVYPAPGRLFAFEVSDVSYHGVEEIIGPVPRVTTACYLLGQASGKETRQRALFMPNRSMKKG
jgi:Rps23 Pro-64 3,4-dihydroxylase Tpa1-like proline 4-hydroxylase